MLRHALGHEIERPASAGRLFDLNEVEAVLLGERSADVVAANETLVEKDPPEEFSATLLECQG